MMKKILKKIKTEKTTQRLLVGALLNLFILTIVNPISFDLLSFLIYISITLIFALNFKIKKPKNPVNFLIMGVVISLIYNYSFMLFEEFTISMAVLFYAALQQGIINYFVVKLWKVK